AWLSVCFFWGTTYLAIRIGVSDMPPALFAGFRHLTAGIIFFSFLMLRGYKPPKVKELWPIAVVGVALLAIANGLVVSAERWVPSGLTCILIATMPFAFVGIEALPPIKKRINIKIGIGLIIGLVGVVLIFLGDLQSLFNPDYRLGIFEILLGMFAWTLGSLYSKRKNLSVSPLVSASVQMMFAGTLLVVFGYGIGESITFHPGSDSFWALVYLIFFGSIVGYTSYIYALHHLPASLVATYSYVNPVIALILGWLILDEKLDLTIILSSAVILAGVVMVTRNTKQEH
ncbi:MAG TPA: EamA family transporter, partial [Ignavibacteriales bacterium]|nr:EamA family transporter [Ignavibacteriales bacterium]